MVQVLESAKFGVKKVPLLVLEKRMLKICTDFELFESEKLRSRI